MLVEDVLRLCGRKDAGTSDDSLEATPSTLDCAARLKRQRICSSGNEESSSGELQDCQDDISPTTATAPSPPFQQPPPCVPWEASYLLTFVHQCLDNLTSLHPSCRAIQQHTKAADMACAIFRRAYLVRQPREKAVLLRERLLAGSLLSASLWLSIKFEANRTTTPDANLMSRISGIPAGLLRQQELRILQDLQFHLMTPAREAGAVAQPDYSDEVCRDQQRQLALLAAVPVPVLPFPTLPMLPVGMEASPSAERRRAAAPPAHAENAVRLAALLASHRQQQWQQHQQFASQASLLSASSAMFSHEAVLDELFSHADQVAVCAPSAALAGINW